MADRTPLLLAPSMAPRTLIIFHPARDFMPWLCHELQNPRRLGTFAGITDVRFRLEQGSSLSAGGEILIDSLDGGPLLVFQVAELGQARCELRVSSCLPEPPTRFEAFLKRIEQLWGSPPAEEEPTAAAADEPITTVAGPGRRSLFTDDAIRNKFDEYLEGLNGKPPTIAGFARLVGVDRRTGGRYLDRIHRTLPK